MERRITSDLLCAVREPAVVQLQVAAAGQPVEERLEVVLDGVPLEVEEHRTSAGGRLHRVRCAPGELVVRYRAVVAPGPPVLVEPLDDSTYLRPSRYVPSDRLGALAAAELGHLADAAERVPAAAAWVGSRLSYVAGSSGPTDGAVETLLTGAGVCRDFAHLVIGLLRALDVPARLVSVYAPGLTPMDFHAVAEAVVDGQWRVVDATLLAPRCSLVRVATGRDAADTAFLTTSGGEVRFTSVQVSAVVDGALPADDPTELVSLASFDLRRADPRHDLPWRDTWRHRDHHRVARSRPRRRRLGRPRGGGRVGCRRAGGRPARRRPRRAARRGPLGGPRTGAGMPVRLRGDRAAAAGPLG